MIVRKPDDPDAPELEAGQAVVMDWSDEEYFAYPAFSRSSLLLLRKDPREFYRRVILREGEPLAASKAMRLGTAAHLAVLEPLEFIRRAPRFEPPRPPGCRKGDARHQQWAAQHASWRQLIASIPGGLALDETQMRVANRVAEVLRKDRESGKLLRAKGRAEVPVLWREPTSGLLVKVKIDRVVQLERGDVYGSDLLPGFYEVDLKTADDISPRGFRRAARTYGLDIQASMYCDALHAATQTKPTHLWMCVENHDKPRPKVAVFGRSPEATVRGRTSYRDLLHEIRVREQNDNWRHEWESTYSVLDI